MSHKFLLSTVTVLNLAASLFAIDEYMPISSRMMQINMGVERTSIPGQYLDTWESNDIPNTNDPTAIPMQGKFGLLDQLEGSMAIRYLIEDAKGHAGLDRPVLGLKYGDPVSGAGGFLSIALPVGFEDIMNAGNFATMTFGAMYNKDFPLIRLFSNVAYSFNTEDNLDSKIDNLHFFGKAEYPLSAPWLTIHKQYVGLNLAAIYDYGFNHRINGSSVDENAHLFQLQPGCYYTFNKFISMEINVPFSISGQNNPETQTFKGQLYFSLDEGLYNAL